MKKANTEKDSLIASSSGARLKATPTPCCSKVGIKRGPWTPEEDLILSNYVRKEGEGRWRTLPKNAGLLRCGKSCRLRWMNYLRPSVKRGRIAPDEEDLILRLHRLLGNRWSLIAGRIPGRTDNEIKNYWNTHLSKKLISQGIDPRNHKPLNPNYNSTPPSNAQNVAPHLPHRVTTTKLSKDFKLMANQLDNIDDYRLQIPALSNSVGNWPSCEQSNPEYCTENGNGNENEEDHIFSSLLDSIINDDENLFVNQVQQQQLHIQQMQFQQQLIATEPSVEPSINVSGAQNFNNTTVWEAGIL